MQRVIQTPVAQQRFQRQPQRFQQQQPRFQQQPPRFQRQQQPQQQQVVRSVRYVNARPPVQRNNVVRQVSIQTFIC